jgi:hypothetical protein
VAFLRHGLPVDWRLEHPKGAGVGPIERDGRHARNAQNGAACAVTIHAQRRQAVPKVQFTRTKKNLGNIAAVIVSVGYQHGWHLLPFANEKATYNFPDDLTSFVLLVQIEGALANGTVTVEMKRDGGTVTPAKYEHQVTPAEAASGEPVVEYQVETL